MKNHNKGLTLVELLVSVAVLSIVTLGIGGLLRLAAVQYSNASMETEVQNMIQTTVASIKNAMVSAKYGVSFDNTEKELTIVNEDNYVKFKKVGSAIYYTEGGYTDESTPEARKSTAIAAAVPTANENLLADHVAKFYVETSTVSTLGMAELQVEIRYMDRTKYLSQNVFVRNLKPSELASNKSGGGTTGGGTTGGGTTGGGTTGGGTTGGGTTGGGTTGGGTTGGGTTGGGTTGGGTTGGGTTGGGTTGGGTTGGGTTGGGTTGGGTTGGGTTGGGTTGGGTTGGGNYSIPSNKDGKVNIYNQNYSPIDASVETTKPSFKKITIHFSEDFTGSLTSTDGAHIVYPDSHTIVIDKNGADMWWGYNIKGLNFGKMPKISVEFE